ncbi:MAG: hypothetical protein EXS63_03995 [Candidatus Omnitrophica bacterium]|nr:hypothetical protein [Candidatus Omnitrophota bacterium]
MKKTTQSGIIFLLVSLFFGSGFLKADEGNKMLVAEGGIIIKGESKGSGLTHVAEQENDPKGEDPMVKFGIPEAKVERQGRIIPLAKDVYRILPKNQKIYKVGSNVIRAEDEGLFTEREIFVSEERSAKKVDAVAEDVKEIKETLEDVKTVIILEGEASAKKAPKDLAKNEKEKEKAEGVKDADKS